MKKISLFLWLAMLFGLRLEAQQDPRYSLFNYNYAILNPAAVGSKEKLSLVVLHRQQWVGYAQSAPYTSTVSLDVPIFKLRSGIGLNIISDNHGIVQNNFVGLSYAIIAQTSEYGRLSLGTNVGINQNRVDFNAIRTDPNNANIGLDPNFNFGQSVTHYSPSVGFGLYYYDRFFKLGISMPVSNSYSYYGVSSGGDKARHLYVTSGVNLILNDRFNYNPRVLFKLVPNAPMQAELYNQFVFDQKWAGGISFRTGESVSGIISYTFHAQFNMSYCYDAVILNQLQTSQFGSHEIGLNYVFPFPKHTEQQKALRIARKYKKCVDFDHPDKKRFFKEVEDLFYDRN